jgi:magnesium transporter
MGDQNHEDKTALHLEHLSEALDSGVQRQVKSLIENLSGPEIGDLLESLPPTKRLAVWELTDPSLDGEILVEVGDEVRAGLIRGMSQEQLVSAVGDLDLDDLADILNDLPDTVISEVMRSMDRVDRERLERVLSYPEDSAGGLMDPNVMTIRRDVSLDVVLRYLRSRRDLKDYMLDQLYVVDRSGRYRGALKVRDLLTNDPSTKVADLLDTSITPIDVTTSSRQVAMESAVVRRRSRKLRTAASSSTTKMRGR